MTKKAILNNFFETYIQTFLLDTLKLDTLAALNAPIWWKIGPAKNKSDWRILF